MTSLHLPPAPHLPTELLGGLTPDAFMQRHWQRQPLLVRQAWPGVQPPATRAQLLALAGRSELNARLVQRNGRQWQVQMAPIARRHMPAMKVPGWTVLVPGCDGVLPAAHALQQRFRFVPDVRLDDVMISWASPGGGVGPHVDSYDVFLLQVQGQRRWRVAPPGEQRLKPGLPLKILSRFKPEQEWLLDPGDLLYLPPGWGHDGVAEGGPCMTCSIGFRAPTVAELNHELLLRLADALPNTSPRYVDKRQRATAQPAAVPDELLRFAREGLRALLADPQHLSVAVGEWASEPSARVVFEGAEDVDCAWQQSLASGVRLDARSRLLHRGEHLFLNGESFGCGGSDASVLHQLAHRRHLTAPELRGLSRQARSVVRQWVEDGWLHPGAIR